MNTKLDKQVLKYIEENRLALPELLDTLCRIPAPSHHEERRAEFCRAYLEKAGAQGVYIDEALNVVYPFQAEGKNDLTVFMAHTDTVFDESVPLNPEVRDGKLYCPGVGDDTASVACLLTAARCLAQGIAHTDRGLLLVCNSGEEGLGNLKGIRALTENYKGRIREVIPFDSHRDLLCNRPVGSLRYRVTARTGGGHSFSNFGNRNAVAALAAVISELYTLKIPAGELSTYNVGTIRGGTSVNTIAEEAQMLFEYRSISAEALARLKDFFFGTLEKHRGNGLDLTVETVGERPCMGDVDPQKQQELTERCCSVVAEITGKRPSLECGSTDSNLPLSLGIPSVTAGLHVGGGAHTREEWIDPGCLDTALKLCLGMILNV